MEDTRAAKILKSLGARVRLARRSAGLPRTPAGIEARLVKHGRLDAAQAGAARIR
ncbi:MAG TPA: hypothetical protein VLH36_12860 [Steroidobacteraceae bacterium]|jgi:hypothetical protein|nr:hypothetical protein [Steroidobacteraceae bacterium]